MTLDLSQRIPTNNTALSLQSIRRNYRAGVPVGWWMYELMNIRMKDSKAHHLANEHRNHRPSSPSLTQPLLSG